MSKVPVQRLAAAERLLVGCDFDGTVAPIVERPEEARALPGAAAALVGLAALPRTHVALVSGRSLDVLSELAGPLPGVVLIGGHGAEWGNGPELEPAARALLAEVSRQVDRIVSGAEGVLVERKPASVAVHVRRCARDVARRVLGELAAGPALIPGVKSIAGKEVLELSVATADKGTALRAMCDRVRPTECLYLGDDVTDEAAFAALPPGSVGIKVGPGQSAAGYRVPDPAAAVELLGELLRLRRGIRW